MKNKPLPPDEINWEEFKPSSETTNSQPPSVFELALLSAILEIRNPQRDGTFGSLERAITLYLDAKSFLSQKALSREFSERFHDLNQKCRFEPNADTDPLRETLREKGWPIKLGRNVKEAILKYLIEIILLGARQKNEVLSPNDARKQAEEKFGNWRDDGELPQPSFPGEKKDLSKSKKPVYMIPPLIVERMIAAKKKTRSEAAAKARKRIIKSDSRGNRGRNRRLRGQSESNPSC